MGYSPEGCVFGFAIWMVNVKNASVLKYKADGVLSLDGEE